MVLAAWKLPPIVAAIAVSIVGGFYLGGPGLGMAVGGLCAAAIVVMAIRHPPVHPIVPASAPDLRRRLLVVLGAPLEAPDAIDEIAAFAGSDNHAEEPEIVVLAAARHRFLDRWASDLGPGRRRAQRALVLSLASLAGAGLDASARVGDEDLVQAVDDQLRSYPATAVVLIAGPDAAADSAASQLRARLRAPLLQIEQSSRPAPQGAADRFAKAR
jgi:hypothetical protein